MNVDPRVLVVRAPLMSINPFNNKSDLSTKEGISVWKTTTDPNKLLDFITLTIKNGNKFLAKMKSKCSEFQLNKFIQILTSGNGVLDHLQGGP